ncbi:AIPR family protein [Dactylosporangium fulvum]|uniref:AIPR family protein n=1 Tax=Dactylosporangium fulvum TaxID=53359 RepID=A0ABY5VTU0_9ACTN|nr:AIPR family protein [Dactylosporangium fulvum]UWP80494.1 AIPR family protein [Dactylosporangium fulvum]
MLERDRQRYDGLGDDHDTFFTARQYLRHYAPTHDDLTAGLVDGHHDGGLDGIYIFANSMCVRDDVPISGLGRGAQIDLFLMQVKNSKGFGEDAVDKLIVNLPRLLDFGRNEQSLSKTLNARVLEITRRFLSAYRQLEMPSLRIRICFASLKAEHLHSGTRDKADELEAVVRGCFGGADIAVDFLDATSVADMARERPVTTRHLALAENPISTSKAGGYVAVVKLEDYEDFITDNDGKLDASLFEANVRDYEGSTSVNRNIQETLSSGDSDVDFWWLNNGVTIVANTVQPAGKLLQLDAPQIVNGLQTSNEIHKRRQTSDENDAADDRSILVKVIQAQDDSVRDRIIRATNSQTSFGPSALRATDKVQRQIEEYLAKCGLYYERRRRHYYNQGKPIEQLVSIDQMGQALLSVMVQTPHIARGEVSRVFEEDIYDLLFAPSHPIQAYASCINIVRETQTFLNLARHTRAQAEDFLYHLSMLTAMALLRKHRPGANDLAAIESVKPERSLQTALLSGIQDEYARVGRFTGEVMLDRMAKDPAVTVSILKFGRGYLATTSKR